MNKGSEMTGKEKINLHPRCPHPRLSITTLLEYKLNTRSFYFFGGMDLRQEVVIFNTYLLHKACLKLPDAEVRQLC
jgi:hypothetical protein